MMNIYNGNVVTDENGFAEIILPEWFEALNKDFRYQLTVIDDSDRFVLAKVVQEIHDNRFTIRTNYGHVKVSWQVTGIRKDPCGSAPHPGGGGQAPRGARHLPPPQGVGPARGKGQGLPKAARDAGGASQAPSGNGQAAGGGGQAPSGGGSKVALCQAFPRRRGSPRLFFCPASGNRPHPRPSPRGRGSNPPQKPSPWGRGSSLPASSRTFPGGRGGCRGGGPQGRGAEGAERR